MKCKKEIHFNNEKLYYYLGQNISSKYAKSLQNEPYRNRIARVLNKYYLDIENRALHVMYKTLTKQGFKVCSLVFDGLQIVKPSETEQRLLELVSSKKILKMIEESIEFQIGLKLSVEFKEMDEGLNLPYNLNHKYPKDCLITKIVDWKKFDTATDGNDTDLARAICAFFGRSLIMKAEWTWLQWNEDTLLYEELSIKKLKAKVSAIVSEVASKGYTHYKKTILKNFQAYKKALEEASEAVDRLKDEYERCKVQLTLWYNRCDENKVTTSFKNNNKIDRIVTKLSEIHYHSTDKDRLANMNRCSPYMLPIKDGLLLNLKDKSTRLRTLEDLYTFEVNQPYVKWCEVEEEAKEAVTRFYKNLFTPTQDSLAYKDWHESYTEQSISFTQVQMGYGLTTYTDNVFFLTIGEGANGKSSSLEEIPSAVIGSDVCKPLPKAYVLYSKNKSRFANGLAQVQHARYVYVNEFNPGDEFDTSELKVLVGGVRDNREIKGTDHAFIQTQFKINMLTNTTSIPKALNSQDNAWKRRFRAIEYPRKFKSFDQESEDLINSLKTTYSYAMFSWYVEGASIYCNDRSYFDFSKIPEVISQATQGVLDDSDSITSFISDELVLTTTLYENKPQFVVKESLFLAYQEYCKANSLTFKGRNKFFEAFEKHQRVRDGGIKDKQREVNIKGNVQRKHAYENVVIKRYLRDENGNFANQENVPHL